MRSTAKSDSNLKLGKLAKLARRSVEARVEASALTFVIAPHFVPTCGASIERGGGSGGWCAKLSHTTAPPNRVSGLLTWMPVRASRNRELAICCPLQTPALCFDPGALDRAVLVNMSYYDIDSILTQSEVTFPPHAPVPKSCLSIATQRIIDRRKYHALSNSTFPTSATSITHPRSRLKPAPRSIYRYGSPRCS